jgi:acetyl esterase
MALDPQVRDLLNMIAAAGNPPMWEQTPQEARAGLAALIALGGPAEELVPIEDRSVPGPAGDIPVRLYRPGTEVALPVVVYFHGGGFVIGDISAHDAICHRLAAGVPALVVSVDYRLAPEHSFPAAVEDCHAATGWVSAHAVELGADPTRLAAAATASEEPWQRSWRVMRATGASHRSHSNS